MFPGIIQEIGKIRKSASKGGYRRIEISFDPSRGPLGRGDSMAVDGTCLTATTVGEGVFAADVSSETQKTTTLGEARAGKKVNLERPLTVSDHLGGHIVLGHVDGMGRIRHLRKTSGGVEIAIQAPAPLMELMCRRDRWRSTESV